MLGLNQYYASPNVGSRSRPLAPVPRVMKVWVGDEPVAILVDANANALLGVAANHWTPAIDKVLDRLLATDADAMYRRNGSIESMLNAGFVYLSFKAAAQLSQDAPSCMVLRALLKAALLKKELADASPLFQQIERQGA